MLRQPGRGRARDVRCAVGRSPAASGAAVDADGRATGAGLQGAALAAGAARNAGAAGAAWPGDLQRASSHNNAVPCGTVAEPCVQCSVCIGVCVRGSGRGRT